MLEPQENDNESASSRLLEAAKAIDTLVADPDGIEELGGQEGGQATGGLLAQAILRGGRGFLNYESATTAEAITANGFEAAQNLEGEVTGRATRYLTELLKPEQSGRMVRVLQSVWEGHGGSPSDFPGPKDLSGKLTKEDLEFLISNLSSASVDFWRRLGSSITVAQLAALDVPDFSSNLNSLINANVDRLMVRAMRIFFEAEQLGEDADRSLPSWSIRRRNLSLRGRGWTGYIAAKSVDELPRPERWDGISVDNLRRRATGNRSRVANVELDTGSRLIGYSSKGDADVTGDDELLQLATKPNTKVHRATVAVTGGRRLICDFSTLTASGHTSATFSLNELVGVAVPLLVAPNDVEMASVMEIVASPNVTLHGEQATLFDE
ncbi:hypothetical protein AB0L06_12320 [Spirillospora sp. NPDC052269]